MSKTLTDYSVEDKVKKFDKMFNFALEMFNYPKEHDREYKDSHYYAWEELMMLLGDDVFDKYNKLTEELDNE